MKICPNCGAKNDVIALKCVLWEFEFSDIPETDNESSGRPDAAVSQVPEKNNSKPFSGALLLIHHHQEAKAMRRS